MKISLPLVSLVFGLACAVLLVGHAEGRIGKETKITVEFSKNPFSFSVRPISNPFYNLVRTNGRKLTAETTTPAANTEDEDDGDEGPPTCTARCHLLIPNLPGHGRRKSLTSYYIGKSSPTLRWTVYKAK